MLAMMLLCACGLSAAAWVGAGEVMLQVDPPLVLARDGGEEGPWLLMVAPPVAAPGAELAVRLWRIAEAEADPWTVSLRASGGELPSPAQVGAGGVELVYTAPDRPGEVVLEAEGPGLTVRLPVLVWPGSGAAQVESTLVGAGLESELWMYWPQQATATLENLPPVESEPGALRIRYAFDAPEAGWVDLTRRTFLRGLPLQIALEVRGGGPGLRLQAILEDAEGQRFLYELGEAHYPDWIRPRAELSRPLRWWGGAGDGRPRYPLSFLSLRLAPDPQAEAVRGELLLRNVFVRTSAPAP